MVRLHRIGFRVKGVGLRAWDFQISTHFEGCPSIVSFRVLVLTIHITRPRKFRVSRKEGHNWGNPHMTLAFHLTPVVYYLNPKP